MDFSDVNARGLVLVGCGRMGGALLDGWLKNGLAAGAVHVIDPNPRAELSDLGISVNGELPGDPAVLLIAVKPQMMAEVLPRLSVGGDTLVISVAAGVTIAAYEAAFPAAPIVRAMPNTPAAIGQGITAIIGNARAGAAQMALAQALLSAVGRVVRLDSEQVRARLIARPVPMGSTSAMLSPSMRIVPSSGAISRLASRSRVVLPEPEPPTMARNSPS